MNEKAKNQAWQDISEFFPDEQSENIVPLKNNLRVYDIEGISFREYMRRLNSRRQKEEKSNGQSNK